MKNGLTNEERLEWVRQEFPEIYEDMADTEDMDSMTTEEKMEHLRAYDPIVYHEFFEEEDQKPSGWMVAFVLILIVGAIVAILL